MPRDKEQYVSAMRKRLDEKPLSDDVEKSWEQLTEGHKEIAKTALGTQKGQSKSWIFASTWEDRKKIKDQMNCVKSDRIKGRLRKDCTEKDREVKKRVKADKTEMLQEMAKKAEEAAERMKWALCTKSRIRSVERSTRRVQVTERKMESC